MFGAMMDSTCILWSTTCSGTGSCLLYDSRKFRLAIHGSALAFQVLALICTVIVYILIKDMVFTDKTDVKEVTDKEQEMLKLGDKNECTISEKSTLQDPEPIV